ncbi:hypothetical protein Trydic_g16793 [Trypoxylus dichotomus]
MSNSHHALLNTKEVEGNEKADKVAKEPAIIPVLCCSVQKQRLKHKIKKWEEGRILGKYSWTLPCEDIHFKYSKYIAILFGLLARTLTGHVVSK